MMIFDCKIHFCRDPLRYFLLLNVATVHATFSSIFLRPDRIQVNKYEGGTWIKMCRKTNGTQRKLRCIFCDTTKVCFLEERFYMQQ